MTNSESFDARLREWLEKSGQALELTTAQSLIRAGLPAKEAVMYRDPTSNKERETDVVMRALFAPRQAAKRLQESRYIQLVVECKYAANTPWVGIQNASHRAPHPTDQTKWVHYIQASDRYVYYDLWRSRCITSVPHCDRILTAFKSTSDGNGRSTAYDATRQALSASYALARDTFWPVTQEDALGVTKREIPTAIAAVVTSAALYIAYLNTEGEVDVKKVDHLVAYTSIDAEAGVKPVHVMNSDAFTSFAVGLAAVCRKPKVRNSGEGRRASELVHPLEHQWNPGVVEP